LLLSSSVMRLAKSPAWLDGQYDSSACVADSALCWRAGLRQTLDVFAPDAASATVGAPVLVVFHGGFWRSLDKSDYSFLAASFTDEGALVVVPNHDLCLEVGMARIAMQLTEAVAWVWCHAAA